MVNIDKYLVAFMALLMSFNLNAREVSGTHIPDAVELANQTLLLNGAGIRSKFIFDIYIGALYLPNKSQDVKQALAMPGAKRVLMHFLYDEVDKQKLTDGWTEGFENNLSDKAFQTLQPRLQDFNKLFITVKTGDQILLDYLPATGTRVTINQQTKGTIPGEDFHQALLMVWLGDDPADEDLKEAMLGN